MKTFLKFLYFLVFLIIIFLLGGIFLPTAYTVHNKILIKASPELVFDQLKKNHNWKNWLPEIVSESEPAFSFSDKSEGVGTTVSWRTNQNTKGMLKLTSVILDSLATFNLNLEPYSYSTIAFSFHPEGKFTELICTYKNMDVHYFERYLMLLYEPEIKSSIANVLQAIKLKAEELRLSRFTTPKQTSIAMQDYMVINDTASFSDVYSRSIELLERLKRYLAIRKIPITGNPITIYYSSPAEEQTQFACGYPIPKRTWGWRDYQCIRLDTLQALNTTHFGLFSSTKPYQALEDFALLNKLVPDTFMWEYFIQTPTTEEDTSLWEKEVFLPIK